MLIETVMKGCFLIAIAAFVSARSGQAAEYLRIPGFLVDSNRQLLSRDGAMVVGALRNEANHRVAATWTAAAGMQQLPLPDGFDTVRVRGMSGDGSVLSGNVANVQESKPFIWSQDAGFQILEGPSDLYRSEALDVSSDRAAVGWLSQSPTAADEQAFVWTADRGMTPLGDLPGGEMESRALAVSDDGSVIVGEANSHGPDQQEPVIWTQQGLVRLAADLEPGATGSANAVSPDGKTVVGTLGWGNGTGGAFRWTAATGVEFIGVYGGPTGVSDDGSVIVGGDNGPPDWGSTQGFIWTEGLGGRRIGQSLVHDHGFKATTSAFGPAYAVSGDGLTVLGPLLDSSGDLYLVRLTDDALLGDVNFDDRVDLDDFAILRKGFGKGIYRDQGDTNLDRRVDLADFGILKANLGTVRDVAVPEPSGFVLMLVGLWLTLACALQRSRKP